MKTKTALHKILKSIILRISKYVVLPLNNFVPILFDGVLCRTVTEDFHLQNVRYSIKFSDFGPQCRSRTSSLLTKEPSTIKWINSFTKNSKFLDVGANMGVYSLYASITQKCEVVALEPCSSSFALLNLNININNVNNFVRAYPVAVSDSSKFIDLNMSTISPDTGGGQSEFTVDARGAEFVPCYVQGNLTTTIDELSAIHDGFDHIKIDTDGYELPILNGAKATLSSNKLKSVLIELNSNLDNYDQILGIFESYGFLLDPDLTSKSYISTKNGGNIYNHIFKKTTS